MNNDVTTVIELRHEIRSLRTMLEAAMRVRTPNQLVREFHEKFEVPILSKPTIPSEERQELRRKLIKEEYEEFLLAHENKDITEIADALADMVYVIYGCALEYGIPLTKVLEEVHRSNMTKVWEDGTIHRREDGKVIKPPTYSPADISKVLLEAATK